MNIVQEKPPTIVNLKVALTEGQVNFLSKFDPEDPECAKLATAAEKSQLCRQGLFYATPVFAPEGIGVQYHISVLGEAARGFLLETGDDVTPGVVERPDA